MWAARIFLHHRVRLLLLYRQLRTLYTCIDLTAINVQYKAHFLRIRWSLKYEQNVKASNSALSFFCLYFMQEGYLIRL